MTIKVKLLMSACHRVSNLTLELPNEFACQPKFNIYENSKGVWDIFTCQMSWSS